MHCTITLAPVHRSKVNKNRPSRKNRTVGAMRCYWLSGMGADGKSKAGGFREVGLF